MWYVLTTSDSCYSLDQYVRNLIPFAAPLQSLLLDKKQYHANRRDHYRISASLNSA